MGFKVLERVWDVSSETGREVSPAQPIQAACKTRVMSSPLVLSSYELKTSIKFLAEYFSAEVSNYRALESGIGASEVC